MAKKITAKKSTEKKAAAKPAKKKTAVKSVKKAAAPAPKKTTAKATKAAKTSKTSAKAAPKKAVKKIIREEETKKVQTKKRTSKKKEQEKIAADDYTGHAEARANALKKIQGYSKKDLEHFKQIILDKRDEIIEQLQNLRDQMMDPTTGEYINENSPYSLHMAEQGTDAMEREKTFLYAQRENKFLGYLEDALKRIESGTYGICIECIEDPQHLCETCPLVPKARLEAVPHSQLCLPIKQKQEKR
jgi:DnaK suppressor protein